MPAQRTGSVRLRGSRWEARVFVASANKQLSIHLPYATNEAGARERAAALSDVAARVCASGQEVFLAECLRVVAEARDARALDKVLGSITRLCANGTEPLRANEAQTFGEVAARWTSGELARLYPDHVAEKTSASTDTFRLERHILPLVGRIVVAEFKLEHAEAVMRALPTTLAPSSRRQVAQLLHRVLAMSVYPLRLRDVSPIPRGWLPGVGAPKAFAWLFPEEDTKLLACADVPLRHRVFYGVLAREGLRKGEAIALAWTDLDLERGSIRLDVNKTDDPRWWALDPGVSRALKIWRNVRDDPSSSKLRGRAYADLIDPDLVFAVGRSDTHAAVTFRRHLHLAGVDRPELFESTGARQPIRLHDLRATFVTLSLAHGKTEAWVSARTGHTTSEMISRYRRAAKTAEELNMAQLLPLDEAIPEFRGTRTPSSVAP